MLINAEAKVDLPIKNAAAPRVNGNTWDDDIIVDDRTFITAVWISFFSSRFTLANEGEVSKVRRLRGVRDGCGAGRSVRSQRHD